MGGTHIIKAMVPLFRRCPATRPSSFARTQGRGSFTMHPGSYEEVPRNLAEEIINRNKGGIAASRGEEGSNMAKEKFDRSKPHSVWIYSGHLII